MLTAIFAQLQTVGRSVRDRNHVIEFACFPGDGITDRVEPLVHQVFDGGKPRHIVSQLLYLLSGQADALNL